MRKNYKTEFHVHTKYSKDSILSFGLILLMAKLKRIDTLVITDHNEIEGALKLRNIFKKYNIEVIVGEEIFTSAGEIIGLNLSKKIDANMSPEDTIKNIKRQKGLVYIPHPYDEKRYKTVLIESEIEKNKDQIDFIEVHNGRNISEKFDIKQNEIANKYKLRKIIGSDAHTFFELGRNYILTSKKLTSDTLLNNFSDVCFVSKKCINFSHKWTRIVRLILIIRKGDMYELFRIVNRKCRR